MIFDLLLTISIPVFIHFPRVAHGYEGSVTFLDISETTALFVVASCAIFSLLATTECILIVYRKIRTKLGYKNARTLSETPLYAAIMKNAKIRRINTGIYRFFR